MTDAVDKNAVLAALRDAVEADLRAVTESQRHTEEAATHEESRPENDKDTRALESSYLARGLAERVAALRAEVSQLATLALRSFGEGAAVALTALVVTVDDDGVRERYFLAPCGGGRRVSVDGVDVQVVTPGSPVGAALLGKRVDDVVELRAGRRTRELEVVAIS